MFGMEWLSISFLMECPFHQNGGILISIESQFHCILTNQTKFQPNKKLNFPFLSFPFSFSFSLPFVIIEYKPLTRLYMFKKI